MSLLDIIMGLIIVWGLVKGIKNGLFAEVAEIIALVVGIYGAIHLSFIVADFMEGALEWNAKYTQVAAFLLTFLIIVVIVNLSGKFLTDAVDGKKILGLMNKIAGAAFGVLKMAVVLGALLFFFEKVTASFNLITDKTRENSVFYKPVYRTGEFIFSKVMKEDNPRKLDRKLEKKNPLKL